MKSLGIKLVAYIAIIMTVLLMIMILSQIQTRGQEEYQKKMSLTPLLGEITAELDMKAKNVETLTQRFHASNQSTLRLVEMFMESGAFKELAAATDMITAAAYRETFYAHGLYGLLDGWIRRDFRETPEEMAQMLRDIIQGQ